MTPENPGFSQGTYIAMGMPAGGTLSPSWRGYPQGWAAGGEGGVPDTHHPPPKKCVPPTQKSTLGKQICCQETHFGVQIGVGSKGWEVAWSLQRSGCPAPLQAAGGQQPLHPQRLLNTVPGKAMLQVAPIFGQGAGKGRPLWELLGPLACLNTARRCPRIPDEALVGLFPPRMGSDLCCPGWAFGDSLTLSINVREAGGCSLAQSCAQNLGPARGGKFLLSVWTIPYPRPFTLGYGPQVDKTRQQCCHGATPAPP